MTATLIVAELHAQSVGIGTSTPHTSSILEIRSTNKGLLLPRVGDTSNVADPAKGLTIYNTANDKIWFYNGSRWEQTGGTDILWYKNQDSVLYSSKKYVGINSDPAFVMPQAELQVNGGLLIQGNQRYSRANPTSTQTYTMDNTPDLIEIDETDSVFRVFDPGGANDYINNTQGYLYARAEQTGKQDGFKIRFNPVDFGLAAGDTLWISIYGYPECRTNYFLRLTNTTQAPQEFMYTDTWLFFNFRSNATATSKGFDITVNRMYGTRSQASLVSASGNAMYFSNGSFAAGYNSNARGNTALALGYYANANGNSAVAIGNSSTAGVAYSTAIGSGANATAEASLALSGGWAKGDNSLAFGLNTVSNGRHAVAMGYYNIAKGNFSFASGISTYIKSVGGTVVGCYNDTSDIANPNVQGSADRIFQVGNGNVNTGARSNAFTILQNGNVGIGTTIRIRV